MSFTPSSSVEVMISASGRLKKYIHSQHDDQRLNELMKGYVKETLRLTSEERDMRYQLKKAFRKLARDRSRGEPHYQLRIDQLQGD